MVLRDKNPLAEKINWLHYMRGITRAFGSTDAGGTALESDEGLERGAPTPLRVQCAPGLISRKLSSSLEKAKLTHNKTQTTASLGEKQYGARVSPDGSAHPICQSLGNHRTPG